VGHCILVVEDDDDAREAIVAILQLTGYQAVPAADGEEALDRLRQPDLPDLILLDLWMPVMDGWEFREEQRKDPTLARIPVVVVSALGAQANIDADEVITKPIDAERLLATVRNYCLPDPKLP